MLAWLSILAFKASGSRKENLGDKLAKFAPGCLLIFPYIGIVPGPFQVHGSCGLWKTQWSSQACSSDMDPERQAAADAHCILRIVNAD